MTTITSLHLPAKVWFSGEQSYATVPLGLARGLACSRRSVEVCQQGKYLNE